MQEYHRPALLKETVDLLAPKPGQVFVDCTLGGAGHTKAILSRIIPGGCIIGVDRDQDAIEQAQKELEEFKDNVKLVRGDFANLAEILRSLSIESVNGILFDLGVSSHQLDVPERGFSFQAQAPLDMRMDKTQPTTAADLVNRLPEKELADMIYIHSDERFSKRIARAIVNHREKSPIKTTTELAEIVASAIPGGRREKIHPATRTFQALRIAVNNEMEALDSALMAAADALVEGGRMCVISYHSLEDRRVKQFFTLASGQCHCPSDMPVCVCGRKQLLKVITRKPVVPTEDEIYSNPRARSAKLRCAEKIALTG